MAKVYKIGEHTFTQRDDGLYMCDEPFTMTHHDTIVWMCDKNNDGYHLATKEESGLYTPLAVHIPAEASRDVFEAYTDSLCETYHVSIMCAADPHPEFLGGAFLC